TRSPITGIVYLAYSGIELVNYYGQGNETVIDQARSNAGFYNVRQERLIAYPLLETSLLGPLRGHVGAVLKHVSSVPSTGTAASGIYGSQGMTLGSGEVGIALDTRSGVLAATRGFGLQVIGRHTPTVFSRWATWDACSSLGKLVALAFGGGRRDLGGGVRVGLGLPGRLVVQRDGGPFGRADRLLSLDGIRSVSG